MKTIEPFGFWHAGATEDESDFFLFSDSGHVGCEQCVTLYGPDAMKRIKELEELVGTPSFEGDTPAMHLANSMQFGAEMVDKYSKLNKRNKELEAEKAELRKDADSWHRAFMALAEEEDK